MMDAPGAFYPDSISGSTTCSLNLLRPSEYTAHLAGSVTDVMFHKLIPVASLYRMYCVRDTYTGVSLKSFAGTTPAGAAGGPPPSPPSPPPSPPPPGDV
jgi:hypothetical protein